MGRAARVLRDANSGMSRGLTASVTVAVLPGRSLWSGFASSNRTVTVRVS